MLHFARSAFRDLNACCCFQIECLEVACVTFLGGKAAQMNTKALLSLAKLGDHVGLASLCEAAAEVMVQMAWEDQIHELAAVLQMPAYRLDLAKKSTLLHHAKRGAYTELQTLEVLEKAEASDDELMTCISLQTLQPEEMQVLLRILSHSNHKPGAFLAKAVQQHTLPACSQPNGKAGTTTRLVDHIMRPEVSNWKRAYDLADTNLKLLVEASATNGKTGVINKVHNHQSSACLNSVIVVTNAACRLKQQLLQAQCMCAGKFDAFLGCDSGIAKQVHALTLFEVCTCAPYVRRCYRVTRDNMKAAGAYAYYGYAAYFSNIMEGHPATFSGPFTIGVCWEEIR